MILIVLLQLDSLSMRLLHTSTYELKEFIGLSVPEYAILSHTWEDEEILFSDLRDAAARDAATQKKGWQKVVGTCEQASKDGLEWVWIDTCCINKESSAELSEAINSMSRYYRESFLCYVYLSGYHVDRYGYPHMEHGNAAFANCRWFTRGWTLQELLAPAGDSMVFFDAEWIDIGTKLGLRKAISRVTRISPDILINGNLGEVSIAAKMSWAADRLTTREEDAAYSLMGIFGVNIPPLYGEGGDRAFMRLQEEIIRYSTDQSIFAWSAPIDVTRPHVLLRRGGMSQEEFVEKDKERTSLDKPRRGLLASSPSDFRYSADAYASQPCSNTLPYSLTNRGLHIHLPMEAMAFPGEQPNDIYVGYLDCELQTTHERLAIYLRKLPDSENIFERCHSDRVLRVPSAGPSIKEIYVSEFPHSVHSQLHSKKRLETRSEIRSKLKNLPKENRCPPVNVLCLMNGFSKIDINTVQCQPKIRQETVEVSVVSLYDSLGLHSLTLELDTEKAIMSKVFERRYFINNPRDQLIIPFDENESLLVTTRNTLLKLAEMDYYRLLLTNFVAIPNTWVSPNSTSPEVQTDHAVPGEIAEMNKKPVVLNMELGSQIDEACSLRVFSNHSQGLGKWYFENLFWKTSSSTHEMTIPDESIPYVWSPYSTCIILTFGLIKVIRVAGS
ncbi:hypothetical protein D9758_016362 [Tetrapyrgos nigripes]|uniref:Heterokaryon incompatibility domain-containing protein n=1 Tax=Tetrapyrgos nigripes TaxID=182062 RepID=A0A8H5CDI8_9AGAR|nr:hypothetical protein D9758_016362 [Tetrapyrgos nigripes]